MATWRSKRSAAARAAILPAALCTTLDSASAQTCGPTWAVPAHPSPDARDLAGLTYDAARARVVLVGGRTPANGSHDDTWEWDGDAWRLVNSGTGPTQRFGFACAYATSPARPLGEVLVFGGRRPVTGFAPPELWAWTGSAWALRQTGGPSARQGAAMAADHARGVAILFGGFDGQYRNDLWEWNGVAWTFRGSGGPPARDDAGMAFDPDRGVLVVFGGFTNAGISNDTWEWSFNTTTQIGAWTQRTQPSPPPARYGAALTFDHSLRRVVMMGGSGVGTTFYGDSWRLDPQGWVQETHLAPMARQTSMAFDQARAQRVIQGGNAPGGRFSDTWTFDQQHWRPVSGSERPQGRVDALMTTDGVRGYVVLAGGETAAGAPLDDTWLWNHGAWGQLAAPFPPRAGMGATFDESRGRVVAFGGRTTGVPYLAETLELSPSGWTPRPIGNPPARHSAAMAYDPTRDVVVMYGGRGPGGLLSETWELSASGWNQNLAPGPTPARDAFGLAYLAGSGGGVVMHGGGTAQGTLDDTWIYNGVWSLVPGAGGPRRDSGVLVTDPARGIAAWLAGSPDTDALADAFEFGGLAWRSIVPVASSQPLNRLRPHAAFDPGSGRIVLFAGVLNGVTLHDTYLYIGYEPPFAGPATLDYLCAGESATFSAFVRGTPPLSVAWLRNGTLINQTANPSAGTPTLVLSPVSIDDNAVYHCQVSTSCETASGESVRLVVLSLDFNHDGVLDQGDIDELINVVAGGPMQDDPVLYDISQDGNIDQDDINLAIDWLASGRACP